MNIAKNNFGKELNVQQPKTNNANSKQTFSCGEVMEKV